MPGTLNLIAIDNVSATFSWSGVGSLANTFLMWKIGSAAFMLDSQHSVSLGQIAGNPTSLKINLPTPNVQYTFVIVSAGGASALTNQVSGFASTTQTAIAVTLRAAGGETKTFYLSSSDASNVPNLLQTSGNQITIVSSVSTASTISNTLNDIATWILNITPPVGAITVSLTSATYDGANISGVINCSGMTTSTEIIINSNLNIKLADLTTANASQDIPFSGGATGNPTVISVGVFSLTTPAQPLVNTSFSIQQTSNTHNPPPVTNLSAPVISAVLDSGAHPNLVNLTWSPIQGAQFYRIDRSIDGQTNFQTLQGSINPNIINGKVTYQDANSINPGHTYSYRVIAGSSSPAASSAYSNIATVSDQSPISNPSNGSWFSKLLMMGVAIGVLKR